jgi:hypothetical protein
VNSIYKFTLLNPLATFNPLIFDSGHESHFDASQEMPPGCRLPGTLNIPAPEFINSEGKIKWKIFFIFDEIISFSYTIGAPKSWGI